jgi:protein-tyrosine phosphatase
MVCLGNICRSPIAEGILQKLADENQLGWVVDSAGTNGYHNGEAPHYLSQKVAKLNGVDISQQRSRQFVKNDLNEYDRIYAMAEDVLYDIKKIAGNQFDEKKVTIFMNELYPLQNKDVPDPWYGAEDGYHEVYGLIEAVCKEIVKKK